MENQCNAAGCIRRSMTVILPVLIILIGVIAFRSSADSIWGDAPYDIVENLDLEPSCLPEEGNCLTMIPGGLEATGDFLELGTLDDLPMNKRGFFVGCRPDTQRAQVLRYPRTDAPIYQPGMDTVSLDHSFLPRFFVWTQEGQFALGHLLNGHGTVEGMWFVFMPEWHCELHDNWRTATD